MTTIYNYKEEYKVDQATKDLTEKCPGFNHIK